MKRLNRPTRPSAISPAPSAPEPKAVNQPVNRPASPIPATRSKSRQAPGREGMLLKNEAGISHRNPRWPVVEGVLRELDPGHINSFACLSLPGNTYIQALRGFNGWHLEWRTTGASLGSYTHMRACYPGASAKPFELKKHDHISAGEHRDLLKLEDVIDSFRCFHRGEEPPPWLEWRELDV